MNDDNTMKTGWDALKERADASGSGTDWMVSGFPGRKIEAWRYTPLTALSAISWKAASPLGEGSVASLLHPLGLPEKTAETGRVIFANGYEIEALSSLPKNVTRLDSPDRGGEESDALKACFSFQLNRALRKKGLHIHVPAGVNGGTVQLVSLSEGGESSTHLHHKIILEEGAELTILEMQSGRGVYLSNPFFEIICAKGAKLRHIKQQRESAEAVHLALIHAEIAEHGDYDSFTLNNGGHLARHEVISLLQGGHANTHVNAVQLVDGARLNDLTSMIHHAAPDCTSRQTVRTILSDKAQGVFQGKILVDRIAQKTDGYQMNQALLLSDSARMNSKPELEIYADDVKCSHGATIGALDEEQLFYLRSRGIPGEIARAMLVQAFIRETISLIGDENLEALMLASLPSEF